MKDGKHMSDVVTREAADAVQTIHGVPHPDPRMRPDRLSIRIPAAFWGRVRRHIEQSHAGEGPAGERALWERWLTPAGVRAVLAAGAIGFGSSTDTSRDDRAGFGKVVERLQTTVLHSLRRPLTLRIDPEQASRPRVPGAEPTYLVVLSNGATLVLRIADRSNAAANPAPLTNSNTKSNPTPARLEDCFFTRAATDIARTAGDSAFPGDVGDADDAADHDGGPIAADPRMRKAVVREWVGRYALVAGEGNLTGLVPPDRPCDVNRGDRREPAPRPAHFLVPTAWGFRGGAHGCRWEGFDGTSTDSAYGDADGGHLPEALRERLDQHVSKRATKGKGREGSGFRSHGPAGSPGGGHATEGGTNGAEPRLTLPRYRLPAIAESDVADSSCLSSPPSHDSRSTTSRDAFACLPELGGAMEECLRARAVSGIAAPVPASTRAHSAYELALALGRCRLLGAESAAGLAFSGVSADFTLAPAVALEAAQELSSRLEQWGQRAEDLVDLLEGATPVRASDLCLGLLESRIEAWAAYVAIDESYSAAVERAEALDSFDHSFSTEIDGLLDRMQAFDEAMQGVEPLLTAAANAPGSRLLENWRALLAAPYRQSPPWWLEVASQDAALEATEEEP